MDQLPAALTALGKYKQFCLYKLVAHPQTPGKIIKKPCDISGTVTNAHNPAAWLDADTALTTAGLFGENYGVGFVFTAADPFYFFDVDNCLLPGGAGWNKAAVDLMNRFPGAAVEVSQSGNSLHIIGTGSPATPSAQRKKKAEGFDLYTEARFVALTGHNIIGDAATIADPAQLDHIVRTHLFKSTNALTPVGGGPVAEWSGPADDAELIEKALKSTSAGAVFGGRASFRNLWESNIEILQECYPDDRGRGGIDESRVDAALMQHLAFWTGNDAERMFRIAQQSELVRDKWEREDYLLRTIETAVGQQKTVYTAPKAVEPSAIAEQFGAVKLRASSDAQRAYADSVRAEKLAQCGGEISAIEQFCKVRTAKFWLDNKEKTIDELKKILTPIAKAADPMGSVAAGATIIEGYQYLSATKQIDFFAGCVYVQNAHKVLTPAGVLLRQDQFNATYGGNCFQLDEGGEKITRKAWEAFTESQIVRWPKAASSTFRPELPAGTITSEDGQGVVNTYVPIEVPRKQGDASPFLLHLAKVLPVQQDQDILLAYMAACVQYKGIKFQWCPLLQGVEGNGKTLFSRCVRAAVGGRYTHFPKASELSDKFNAWAFDKLFIGIEDIYVPSHKLEILEILKPMITNDELPCRDMQAVEITRHACFNLIMNCNRKDSLAKSRNDRRLAILYSAQQEKADLARDGMGGRYFPDLYRWLKEQDGYAIVTDYLYSYEIPVELNPADASHVAPETSSTQAAIAGGLGGVEQEILEAIEAGVQGFRGGWVSSVAVDRLLQNLRLTRAIPPNKRREMMQGLGYDWHSALINGRANNPILIDEGKKPKLFIKKDHISANLSTGAEACRVYQEAQGVTDVANFLKNNEAQKS